MTIQTIELSFFLPLLIFLQSQMKLGKSSQVHHRSKVSAQIEVTVCFRWHTLWIPSGPVMTAMSQHIGPAWDKHIFTNLKSTLMHEAGTHGKVEAILALPQPTRNLVMHSTSILMWGNNFIFSIACSYLWCLLNIYKHLRFSGPRRIL